MKLRTQQVTSHRTLLSTDENVIAMEAFVDFEVVNSLDNILERTPIPRDFDLLSIDVDGVDYHIFDSLRRFIPKVV